MGPKWGGGDTCAACHKVVYVMEKVEALGGAKFHKTCFKCATCKKVLELSTAADHDGVMYCNPCHRRNFGPKGIGFGVGAGTLHTT